MITETKFYDMIQNRGKKHSEAFFIYFGAVIGKKCTQVLLNFQLRGQLFLVRDVMQSNLYCYYFGT